MDEDRLSPELGRLIDEAKTAARTLDAADPAAEGVALLCDQGDIYTGAAVDPASHSAAHLALEKSAEAGAGEVLAAAIAAPYDTRDSVTPSAAVYERLVELDPDLPLVVKRHGRWVMLPASRVTPSS